MICKNITKRILNGLVYIKGKFLKVTNKDFFDILKLLKESLMQKLGKQIAVSYTHLTLPTTPYV